MEMAPSPLGQPAPQLPSPAPLEPNLRNPLPLSAAQEAQVRDLYYKKVRKICDDVIKGTEPVTNRCLGSTANLLQNLQHVQKVVQCPQPGCAEASDSP